MFFKESRLISTLRVGGISGLGRAGGGPKTTIKKETIRAGNIMGLSPSAYKDAQNNKRVADGKGEPRFCLSIDNASAAVEG